MIFPDMVVSINSPFCGRLSCYNVKSNRFSLNSAAETIATPVISMGVMKVQAVATRFPRMRSVLLN